MTLIFMINTRINQFHHNHLRYLRAILYKHKNPQRSSRAGNV